MAAPPRRGTDLWRWLRGTPATECSLTGPSAEMKSLRSMEGTSVQIDCLTCSKVDLHLETVAVAVMGSLRQQHRAQRDFDV